MAKVKKPNVIKPISFPIRPANRGLNVSVAPQIINLRESPETVNCRFNKGQIQTRNGFNLLYTGCLEAPLWIDVVYSDTAQKLIAFTWADVYLETNGLFDYGDMYNGQGVALTNPALAMDPTATFISINVGETNVHFNPDGLTGDWANSGNQFPASSGVASVMIMTNGADGIYIFAYTGVGTGVEGQKTHDDWCLGAPTIGDCVAVFNNRMVVGGPDSAHTTVAWSSRGRFDRWDTGTYDDTGEQVLGDSPDWILAMHKLGEYLITYRERSMWIGRITLVASPALIFEPVPGQGVGLAAPNSIGDLGEEHIFLGWDDVYIFSLAGLQAVGTRIKQEMFYGTYGIIPKYIRNCQGVIAEEFDEYWLFVPTGRWPEDTDYAGAGPENSVENVVTNPVFAVQDGGVPTNWAVGADGNGAVAMQTGGNFNDDVARLTMSTGTWITFSNTVKDYNTVLNGDTFSVLVWLKASGACNIRLDIISYNSGSVNPVIHASDTIALTASSTYQCKVFSVVINDADGEQVKVRIWLNTTGVNLDIDAVQLIRMDGLSIEFWHGVSGEQAPGFLGVNDIVERIPFIVDRVGQWCPDSCWVYNYEENAWSLWRIPMSGFGYDSTQTIVTIADLIGTIKEQSWRYDERRIQELAPTNLIGGPDGSIWEMSAEHVYDYGSVVNRAYLAYWESKDFDLDRPDLDKTFSRLVIYHEAAHAAITLTVGVSLDSGTTWQEQDITLRSGHTTSFADFFVTGNQIRFRIKSESAFYITGFNVSLIPRGEAYDY